MTSVPAHAQTPDPEQSTGTTSPATAETKARLEVQKLRFDNGWGRIGSVVPGIAVSLTFLALTGGAWRYLSDRRRDNVLRIDEGVRTNLQIVIDSATAENSLAAALTTALDNLSALHDQARGKVKGQIEARVTDTVTVLAREDINYDNVVAASFDGACLRRWQPYGKRLRANPAERRFILSKYVDALKKLQALHPDYFESLQVDPDGNYQAAAELDDKTFHHFRRLAAGYQLHAQALTDGEDKNEAVDQFGDAVRNRELAFALLT